MDDIEINKLFNQIKTEVKLIQKGKKPINRKMVSVVNSYLPNLINECKKCGVPLLGGLAVHEKNCDGIPILKVWRSRAKHQKTLTQKHEKQREVIKKAIMCDDWYEYDKMCNDAGMRSDVVRRSRMREAGVHDLYLERHQSMKNYRYYTTTNCSHCGKEVKVRKKETKGEHYHCKRECYLANLSKIRQKVNEKKWNKKYGDVLSWGEWSQHKIKNFKHYRRVVNDWMRHNLKKYKPEEWKYYQETEGMAIDHHYFPVIEGFRRMSPPNIVSHSDNLQVITVSENSKKNDTIIHEGMPDFLVDELKKPMVLSRVHYDGPPKKER